MAWAQRRYPGRFWGTAAIPLKDARDVGLRIEVLKRAIEIGLPLMLLSMSEGHERAVLEMGFYVRGEIALLCDLAQPEIGVITNIGTVHASRAGSQETIARGKAELVEALPAPPTVVRIPDAGHNDIDAHPQFAPALAGFMR